MYTLPLLPTLLALTTTALAHPQRAPAPDNAATGLSPAAPSGKLAPLPKSGGVFFCEHVNWLGKCEHRIVQLGSGPNEMCNEIDGTTSSIGPDEGFSCYFFTNAVCDSVASDHSDFVQFDYPGNANLVYTNKGNYNDKFLSFQCINAD